MTVSSPEPEPHSGYPRTSTNDGPALDVDPDKPLDPPEEAQGGEPPHVDPDQPLDPPTGPPEDLAGSSMPFS